MNDYEWEKEGSARERGAPTQGYHRRKKSSLLSRQPNSRLCTVSFQSLNSMLYQMRGTKDVSTNKSYWKWQASHTNKWELCLSSGGGYCSISQKGRSKHRGVRPQPEVVKMKGERSPAYAGLAHGPQSSASIHQSPFLLGVS